MDKGGKIVRCEKFAEEARGGYVNQKKHGNGLRP